MNPNSVECASFKKNTDRTTFADKMPIFSRYSLSRGSAGLYFFPVSDFALWNVSGEKGIHKKKFSVWYPM